MKKGIKKGARFWLCIALALCLVSMIGTACMERGWGKVKVTEYNITLRDLIQEIKSNNEKTGKNIQVTFKGGSAGSVFGPPVGDDFHFRLFVPKTATAENPAPAVICAHGGSNVLEMQMPFYVELARRGFVVISMDLASHGETDSGVDSLTGGTQGMLAAVEFAMSLPCVDETKIGVTGHSAGNTGCINSIKALNTPDSTQKIRAYVNGDAAAFLSMMFTEECTEDVIMTLGSAMYGEAKSAGGYYVLESDLAKKIAGWFDPGFDGSNLIDGQYYSSEGMISAPALGEALTVDKAFTVKEFAGTHPMWHFSKAGAKIAIEGFYAGLGTPSGVAVIDADKQVWQFETCFELLGLIGIFMLLFPLVTLLSETKFFSAIRRSIPERSEMPSIKDPRRLIIFLLTFAVCVLYAFFSYKKLYPLVNAYMDGSVYPGNSAFTNPIGLWTMACGMFTLVVIGANWALTRLICRDKSFNPFESCSFSSVSQFLKTVLFSVTVVAIIYAVVALAGIVFKADFRICTLAIQIGDPKWMFTVLNKYMPMWLLFYIPYAILNSNTRFKDMPEWLELVILAIANCLALVIYAWIQYHSLVVTHGVKPLDSFGGIACFTLIPVLGFAVFSSRHVYKKTGSALAAGLINGIIFCLMTVFGNGWGADFMFF